MLEKIKKNFEKNKMLIILYLTIVFFAIHNFSSYYILPDFLNGYFKTEYLSILFAGSSLLAIISSNFFGKFLKKFSNEKTLIFILVFQFIFTFFLGFSDTLNLYWIAIFFILNSIFNTLIWVSLNVFIEEFSSSENIGKVRSIILTIYNIFALSTPFLASFIYTIFKYQGVFILSGFSLLPLIFLINKFFKHISEPKYNPINLITCFKLVWKDKNLKGIITSSFVLNSFYAINNIYMSLYLIEYVKIPLNLYLGLIVPITLIPFILVPYQIGKYADKKDFNKKKIMILGILIMSISILSVFIFKFNTQNILFWIALIFVARLGATLTETENYAYFYQKVDSQSVGLISLFQNMSNISFLIINILSAILIKIFNIQIPILFLVFALISFISIFIIQKINNKDMSKIKN